MRITLGLRTKMLLLSSFLLILPWFGYKTINEMEAFLLKGQENVLKGTTQAIAAALHNRPQLFNQHTNQLTQLHQGKDLSAFELDIKIDFDGRLNDWHGNNVSPFYYDKDFIQLSQNNDSPDFNLYLGQQKNYLYGAVEVFDKNRNLHKASPQNQDQLVIALTDKENRFQRYAFHLKKSGYMSANTISLDQKQIVKNHRITAFLRMTKQGYNIEFRLPLTSIGEKFSVGLIKTNKYNTRTPLNIIASSALKHQSDLGTLLAPSREIKNILIGMKQTKSDLQLLDLHQRVISESISQVKINKSTPLSVTDKLLNPIYNLILKTNTDASSSAINNENVDLEINEFLDESRKTQKTIAFTLPQQSNIHYAVTPIKVGNNIMGFVLAKQTSDQTLLQLNSAIKKMTNVFLITLFVAAILLFLFSTNITFRIRKLRNQADTAIDDQGRILNSLTPSTSSDEIGDLSRCLSAIIERQSQYNEYLEKLSSRLSHELRTPIAVTRSSLENLSQLPQNEQNKAYIDRAETGIKQLNQILNSMSEATRIEHTLESSENITFPINELRDAAVDRYSMTFEDYLFTKNSSDQALCIHADPDFIMQLLDKLVSNAMDFTEQTNPIEISTYLQGDHVCLSVSNIGPLLPEKMKGKLLDSMVSIRSSKNKTGSNLGLGLYIANTITQFYKGNITIKNRDDNQGVEVIVLFPMEKNKSDTSQ